jgi:hypothetical protein
MSNIIVRRCCGDPERRPAHHLRHVLDRHEILVVVRNAIEL